MLVEGRTEAQINRAKRAQMARLGQYGANPGQRKKCKRGKSCGATCISNSLACLVDITWALAPGISTLAGAIHNKGAGQPLTPPTTVTAPSKAPLTGGRAKPSAPTSVPSGSATPPPSATKPSPSTTPPATNKPLAPGATPAKPPGAVSKPVQTPRQPPRKQEVPKVAVFLLRQLVNGLERHDKAMKILEEGAAARRAKAAAARKAKEEELQNKPQG